MSAAEATWIALITLTPVRRATSAQKEAPSSPFSWTIESCSSSTARATSGRVGLTNTPTISQLAPECGGDLRGDAGIDVPRRLLVVDQPDRPRTEPHRLGGVVQIGDPAELDAHSVSLRE